MSAVSYYLIFPLHLRHQVITITELTENIQCPTNWVKFSISGQLQPYIFNFVKINLIWNMEKIPPQTPVIVNDGSQIDRKSLVPFQLLAYNLVQTKNKTKRLIDAITSNNGYGRKIGLIILTYLLTDSHTPNLEMLSHLKTLTLQCDKSDTIHKVYLNFIFYSL